MNTVAFSNTTEDGQVPGLNPDGVTDYFLITDYNNDKNYFLSKITDALKFISANPTRDFQILYGGVISDSGSSQIDISEGAAIGKDASGNFRIVQIPSLTNVSLPSGWNNNRQIWLIGKYAVKLDAATRQHFNGTTYQYRLLDSYLGEGATDNLFLDADPGDTVVKWGSFKMNGTTFSDQYDRSPIFTIQDKSKGTINGGLIFNSTSLPPKISSGSYNVGKYTVSIDSDRSLALTDTYLQSKQTLDSFCHYTVGLGPLGQVVYVLNGEGPVSGATGTITSITGSGTTKTLTVATGTVGSHSDKIIVISGNTGVNGVFKVTGGNGSTTYTFESISSLTGTGGTWTIYERIKTLHGTGSATAITVDADVLKYTPSYGENGWPYGFIAFDPTRNGFFYTLPGLTEYMVLGNGKTNGSANFQTDIVSHKTGRNKNDNSFLITTYSTISTNAYKFSSLVTATGCDYIWDNSSITLITFKRPGYVSSLIQTRNASGGHNPAFSFDATNTQDTTSSKQFSDVHIISSLNLGSLPPMKINKDDTLRWLGGYALTGAAGEDRVQMTLELI